MRLHEEKGQSLDIARLESCYLLLLSGRGEEFKFRKASGLPVRLNMEATYILVASVRPGTKKKALLQPPES